MAVGYGIDTWCTGSVVTGRLASGSLVVVQAMFRRLITPRGMLRGGDEEANYGIDLAAFVGKTGFETSTVSLPGIIQAELLKDDRVASATAAVSQSERTDGTIFLEVRVFGILVADDEDFDFTVAVDEVTVDFLGGATNG